MLRAALVALVLSLFVPRACAAGLLAGRVVSARTGEPLAEASVSLQGTGLGCATDSAGGFRLADLRPGLYNVQVGLLGFRRRVLYEIGVTSVKPTELEVALEPEALRGDTVTVTASPFRRTAESPVSVRSIGVSEIERSPGGGRDISRVIQSLPGVASSVSFRNDVVIRGGAPNENRFYLDGVEVPNINHFATQGSSGGPVGMINVDLIRDVDLYTGAFPAARGNALSSVMEFRLKDGNPEKRVTTATLGATDLGLTMDGPVGSRTSYLFSARRSYLQALFKAIGLPFLPTYNDAQFKLKSRPGERDELTLLGLGAIDRIRLNPDANDTEEKRAILDAIPVTPQWNYTVGGTWRHLGESGVTTVVLSRNQLDNQATKYTRNQDTDPAALTLDYHSQEIENKLRVERSSTAAGWQLGYGAGVEDATYTNSTYQKTPVPSGVLLVDFHSRLTFGKYGAFAQASRELAGGKLSASLGVRTDFTDYSGEMGRPLDQLSPRLALSWAAAPSWSVNMNAGRYYQLPAYTVLGYRDSLGALVNKENGARYIRCDHLVGGVEHTTSTNSRVSLEAFYKRYADYPFLTRDSISLANLGANFGVIGNAPAVPSSRGRSYGVELLVQQKLYHGLYGIGSYTFVRSEFTTRDGSYAPSAWDNRHLLTLTGGKQLGRGWDLGARWRYVGGPPYTPDDPALSSLKTVWDAAGMAVKDWKRLNTLRTGPLNQLDVRVDKKWFGESRSADFYLDVQNIFAQKVALAPALVVDRDPSTGLPLTDPNDPARYGLHTLIYDSGNVLPTIGVVVEF